MKLRRKHHGSIFRDAREHPCRLLYDLIYLIQPAGIMVADVTDLCIAELRALHEAVDIKPVRLVGWDAPGGGVRLFEIPHLLEVGHLVADRCGGKADICMLCNRAGTDRRSGHDIIVNNRLQDLHFSCIQFHSGSSFPACVSVIC